MQSQIVFKVALARWNRPIQSRHSNGYKQPFRCYKYPASTELFVSLHWKLAILSDDLTHKSATELVALIQARAVSPVEVAAAHLKRIEEVNPSLNAIVTIADDVIHRARDAEDGPTPWCRASGS